MYGVNIDGYLVPAIAEQMPHWTSCNNICLQSLAVKIVANLSVLHSKRIAVGDTGILKNVVG